MHRPPHPPGVWADARVCLPVRIYRGSAQHAEPALAIFAGGVHVLLCAKATGSVSCALPVPERMRAALSSIPAQLAAIRAAGLSSPTAGCSPEDALARMWLALRFLSRVLSEAMPGSAVQAFPGRMPGWSAWMGVRLPGWAAWMGGRLPGCAAWMGGRLGCLDGW